MFGVSITPIILATVGVAVTAIGGGVLTKRDRWYFALNKPSWQPPDWLFGPVWTTIFLLTAIAFVLVWERAPDSETRARLGGLFALNLGLNVLWSFLFFNRHRPDFALAESVIFLISIVHLIVVVGPFDSRAGWALAPYLVWVSFATILNAAIVRLNPIHDAISART